MLRARNRGPGPIRASTYQYAPRFLVYRRDTEADLVPEQHIAGYIGAQLPPALRPAWNSIARGLVNRDSEQQAEVVADWISQHGPERGFRIPNVRERSRAMGMAAYLQELQLDERELYDGQGNSFDPQAVCLRLHEGLRSWLATGQLARHCFPMISVAHSAFQEVLSYVQQRGLHGVEHPFPYDLRGVLVLDPGNALTHTPPVVHDGSSLAAEYGRVNG